MIEPPRTFVLTVNRPISRFDATAEHLDSLGIKWERFNGMDNQLCQLSPIMTFDLDRVGERIDRKHIAATLSHYLIWKCMSMQPDDSFWVLEYDVEFVHNWRGQFEDAMSVMPDDWDVIFLGSCCTADKPQKHVAKTVYEVFYPLCGHAMAIRKKALPVLLQEHQRIYQPLDIAMASQSLPKLRVYTILPAIIGQRNTPLPP